MEKELLKQKFFDFAKDHKKIKNIREFPNKLEFDYYNDYVTIYLVRLCSLFNDCLIGTNPNQTNHLIIRLFY